MGDASRTPCIYVLAGVNGAGKSSIAGAMFRQQGVKPFDPDEATRLILWNNPSLTQEEANSLAWHQGRQLLEKAIAEKLDFVFETTLGGTTITNLLESALSSGIEVRVWYVGLESVELHIARVRSRVEHGGHDVPEWRIRERFDTSRINLIRLLPNLTELRLYDNGTEADLLAGATPQLFPILHLNLVLVRGKIIDRCDLEAVPEWAKPILVAAKKSAPGPAQRSAPDAQQAHA